MSVRSAHNSRLHRHQRVRARLSGTSSRPRLVVFRSLKHIYAQIIDDTLGKTLVAASDREITGKDSAPEGITNRKMVQAYQVGALLGSKAADKKINTVVFDRGGYRYHGRVKALAEGARAEKLQF